MACRGFQRSRLAYSSQNGQPVCGSKCQATTSRTQASRASRAASTAVSGTSANVEEASISSAVYLRQGRLVRAKSRVPKNCGKTSSRAHQISPRGSARRRHVRAASGHLVLAHPGFGGLRHLARRALLSRRVHAGDFTSSLAADPAHLAFASRARTRPTLSKMIPAAVVFAYLAIVLYIGIFAFRTRTSGHAEDFFLAGRSLGPMVFLLSLFGSNMTAFSILGASGHAFANGIVTYGLMASSSALIIPVTLLVIGTRLWALGKRYGFMTPVQMFRDRWSCGHIGTVIFVVQAVLLVPYIIIAVMGGGTTLATVSHGAVPYWLGGAIVSLVVMSYVFLGGMRGTAWVNTFQTILFLLFGAIAVTVVGAGMGGFRAAMESMLASPSTAPLLTRARISPWYFFSYTFIPLSSIVFPHIGIFCLTARRIEHFRKTIVLYPLCMILIWLPSVFLGVVANRSVSVPAIAVELDAGATLAAP